MQIRNFKPYLRAYKKAFVLIPLFVLIDVACEVTQPRLMASIVDQGILKKDLSLILFTGAEMIGLALIAILANIGNVYYSSQASVGFATDLRNGLFRKIQSFSFADTDQFSAASLTTRMTNDTNTLQQVMMMSLRMLLRAPLMLIFAVFFAVLIDRELALILTVSIPLLTISIILLLKNGLPYFILMQKRLDKLNGTVLENLINVRIVKSFVRQDFEKYKFSLDNKRLMEVAAKASGIVVMIMPVMQLVMGLSLVAVVWFGGHKVVAGNLPVGKLMSFISYITQILISLMILSMVFMMLSRAIASGDRIEEVLLKEATLTDTPEALQSAFHIQQGQINFDHVGFRYNQNSEKPILQGISFQVRAGSTTAIIGSTGSGKSTLVQLIPRLYDLSEGVISIDGINIRNYQLQILRAETGIVLQKNQLFSGTIMDNLKWGNEQATEAEIREAAKIACAADFIESFPDGYSTILGQGGVNLSGGQKQRISIARTLLRKPKILILDDSTSAVDTETEQKIRAGLVTYLKNTTLLIIAQRISSVMHADQIIVLNEGQLAAQGTHAELLKNNQVYQEIYASQHLQKEWL